MYKNFKEALEKEQLIQLGNIVERKRLNYLYADWQYWQSDSTEPNVQLSLCMSRAYNEMIEAEDSLKQVWRKSKK